MEKQEKQLIIQAKNGCEESFECIFKKYMPIVLHQKNKTFLRFYELDDWLQEGRIVCHQSINRYEFNKNVTFGLFFKINFERWAISAIRYQEAQKRQIYKVTDSLDCPKEATGESLGGLQEDLKAVTSLEYIFVRENLENFSSCLSKFEKLIYQFVLQGEDIESIAKYLNVPQAKVECGYSRLKRKLKNQIS